MQAIYFCNACACEVNGVECGRHESNGILLYVCQNAVSLYVVECNVM